MIVWISIDNSNDRLSQAVWAEFIKAVDKVISTHAIKRYASMVHSLPNSDFMNCHWCIELPGPGNFITSNLQNELAKLAKIFKQDSIAWNECKPTKHIQGINE